jgi:AraC family transcriptional regulator, transcriptional activator FtrA
VTARRAWRWVWLVLAFLTPPALLTLRGLRTLDERQRPSPAPRLSPTTVLPAAPVHDPGKRTVVVLLGADVTEMTDALGPYEMFARAGVFNVYAAAPERQPTLLSGGLQILPHHGLAELDAVLGGQPPAIVVVPQIPNIASAPNRPLVDWMRRQATAGALMHSWCTGAMALAEADLLDGLTATAHWGDIDRLVKRYPRVRWVRGVRWVDHGHVITSAGLTSGVDASLRVLSKTAGEEIARRVADEMRYPNFHFSREPAAPPYAIRAADTVLLANAAFRFSREQIGLALYGGVGELDLSNVYDTHAYSAVADVHGIATAPGFVRTAHGLTLMPAWSANDTDARAAARLLDRLVVPGRDPEERGTRVLALLRSLSPRLQGTHVHRDPGERFGLEPVLEDLARTSDSLTARFAQRRLEYRSASVRLDGPALPWQAATVVLGSGLVGVGLAMAAAHALQARGNTPPTTRSYATERPSDLAKSALAPKRRPTSAPVV